MAKFSDIFGVDKGIGPGTVSLEALLDEVKFGLMPVGTVFPVMTNIAGAPSAPASGVVADGLMLCDGAAIPALLTLSGSTPNLSGDAFLQGSSSAGVTGGANTINLQHSHTVDSHTHSNGTYAARIGRLDSTLNNTIYADDSGYQTMNVSGYHIWNINSTGASGTTVSIRATGVSGTSGTASASGTNNQLSATQDNRPSYITVQYLIRVI